MSISLPAACLLFSTSEPGARLLEGLISQTNDLRHAATLSSLEAAQSYLQAFSDVSVLLIEVEGPDCAGLRLVRELTPSQAHLQVILVASSPACAAEAFNLHVADFLVKPVSSARFLEAVAQLARRQAPASAHSQAKTAPSATADENAGAQPELPATSLSTDDTCDLFVKVNNRLVRINFDEVLYLEAMSTYSILVMAQQKHIVHLTLKHIAERMPFAHFLRVHRSYIVNTRLIDCVEDRMLILAGHSIPLAKSYQTTLFKVLRTL